MKLNNILELKGKRFIQASKTNPNSGVSMNGKKIVTEKQLLFLKNRLEEIKNFWKNEKKPFEGALISVYYNKIVAKSNRIGGLFKGDKSNFAVVGAKFNKEKTKHIITYFLSIQDIENSISLLSKALTLIKAEFNEGISQSIFENKDIFNKIDFKKFNIKKTSFKNVIADASYIEDFQVEMPSSEIKQSIITLFNVGIDTKLLLKSIGVNLLSSRMLDHQTIFLDEDQLKTVFEKIPYLVSMSTINIADLSPDDFIQKYQENIIKIPSPTIEPTIGVIDTLFDKRVYFNEWVEYYDMIENDIPKTFEDYNHGTAVSSIIVDGPRLNPWLDDECGRFKVRHFGVALGSKFSSFSIIKQIKNIISNNKDIRVWNLSLGSKQEINDNFISAEAAILDQIQYENNVIFVIAGTNRTSQNIVKIGSPADSINSLVVNSVTRKGLSTKYTRRGLAASFFAKPDVSYYGGSKEQYIQVCEPSGSAQVAGTSYAAPWIARKLSYLIDILGLNREVAKALIIDSARSWNEKPSPEEVAIYGHGIVPIKISDIIKTKEDEIRFLVSDISEKWNTYNYNFPIPLVDDTYPYVARATMCYFPKCDRTQGVDYTNTELNIHFGRIKDNGKLNEINDDKQNQENLLFDEKNYIFEGEARKRFRKWDNVKYITEIPKIKNYPKKSYKNKNWGMEIKTNNRLDPKDGENIRFGVVVTLKEINGINRIDDFIRNCILSGWLVNQVDIKNRIDIHKKINEEIKFK